MTDILVRRPGVQWGALEWEKDPRAEVWDHNLAQLGGHPLQSCLWGDAREQLDGIAQLRWLARRDGEPVWMIRVEERKVLGGKIAWAPRGPTGRTADMSLAVPPGFEERLRAEGFSLLISDPWVDVAGAPTRPQTIWINLSPGKDILFKNLDKRMRWSVRRAQEGGVRVHGTSEPKEINKFVDLCSSISKEKGFDLRLTPSLIEFVLAQPLNGEDVEAVQFVAQKNGKVGSGLFIFRVGKSVHQIWSGTDRGMIQDRVGEACQWGVIEWAIARGCTRYDLEGIDPIKNPSVYAFKKRLGGEEITLRGHIHTPLKFSGRVMSWLARRGVEG